MACSETESSIGRRVSGAATFSSRLSSSKDRDGRSVKGRVGRGFHLGRRLGGLFDLRERNPEDLGLGFGGRRGFRRRGFGRPGGYIVRVEFSRVGFSDERDVFPKIGLFRGNLRRRERRGSRRDVDHGPLVLGGRGFGRGEPAGRTGPRRRLRSSRAPSRRAPAIRTAFFFPVMCPVAPTAAARLSSKLSKAPTSRMRGIAARLGSFFISWQSSYPSSLGM